MNHKARLSKIESNAVAAVSPAAFSAEGFECGESILKINSNCKVTTFKSHDSSMNYATFV